MTASAYPAVRGVVLLASTARLSGGVSLPGSPACLGLRSVGFPGSTASLALRGVGLLAYKASTARLMRDVDVPPSRVHA